MALWNSGPATVVGFSFTTASLGNTSYTFSGFSKNKNTPGSEALFLVDLYI